MSRVLVSDLVSEVRHPHKFRWLVVACFDVQDGEAFCIDYRVRLLPEGLGVRELRSAIRAAESVSSEQLPEGMPIPGGGLPVSVLRVASPSRLAAKASEKVRNRRVRGSEVSRALDEFAAAHTPKRGRPPVMGLLEKLIILESVEAAYGEGRTLENVAEDHLMSRGAVRDLVSWARNDAKPQLFTKAGPGRRGGRLTPEGRAILAKLSQGESHDK
jgi:hypothetical protein